MSMSTLIYTGIHTVAHYNCNILIIIDGSVYLIAGKGSQLQIDGSKPRAWQTEGAGCVVMRGLLL